MCLWPYNAESYGGCAATVYGESQQICVNIWNNRPLEKKLANSWVKCLIDSLSELEIELLKEFNPELIQKLKSLIN